MDGVEVRGFQIRENRPDAFRCAAVELLAWMRAKPVSALIESCHDDTD
jgi:hypothetical protein